MVAAMKLDDASPSQLPGCSSGANEGGAFDLLLICAASYVALLPNVRVRSICRLTRSSCISFWAWLASVRRRLRNQVMEEWCAAVKSASPLVEWEEEVRRAGRKRERGLVLEATSAARPVGGMNG